MIRQIQENYFKMSLWVIFPNLMRLLCILIYLNIFNKINLFEILYIYFELVYFYFYFFI